MGCDIHGQIEFFDDRWRGLVDLGRIVDRAYTPFRILFNVRNYDRIPLFDAPLFPNRGIPDGFDRKFNSWGDHTGDHPIDEIDHHSHSFFTYADLKAVNWREKHAMRDIAGLRHRGVSTEHWEETTIDYRVVLRYKCWQTAFRIMRALSKQYGAENVRCVVWFDN